MKASQYFSNLSVKTISALLMSAGLVLSGCASKSPDNHSASSNRIKNMMPDWVTEATPLGNTVYGVGSAEIFVNNPADAIKRATDIARVNMIGQLRVNVSGSSSQNITERSLNGQSDVIKTFSTTARSSVKPVTLDEIEMTESYLDQANQQAYVRVRLDRVKAARRLRRDVQTIEENILEIEAQPLQGSPLQQVQQTLPALKLYAQRLNTVDKYMLVSTTKTPLPLSDELKMFQKTIYRLLDELVVKVVAKNNGAKQIEGGVIEALTNQGMRISNTLSPDLIVNISAELNAVAKNNSHYVFADSQISLSDQNGRILSSFSKKAKGASGYEKLARKKASESLAKIIAKDLAKTLVEKID